MTTPVRVAGFLLGLLVVFLAARGVGAVAAPDPAPPAPCQRPRLKSQCVLAKERMRPSSTSTKSSIDLAVSRVCCETPATQARIFFTR